MHEKLVDGKKYDLHNYTKILEVNLFALRQMQTN